MLLLPPPSPLPPHPSTPPYYRTKLYKTSYDHARLSFFFPLALLLPPLPLPFPLLLLLLPLSKLPSFPTQIMQQPSSTRTFIFKTKYTFAAVGSPRRHAAPLPVRNVHTYELCIVTPSCSGECLRQGNVSEVVLGCFLRLRWSRLLSAAVCCCVLLSALVCSDLLLSSETGRGGRGWIGEGEGRGDYFGLRGSAPLPACERYVVMVAVFARTLQAGTHSGQSICEHRSISVLFLLRSYPGHRPFCLCRLRRVRGTWPHLLLPLPPALCRRGEKGDAAEGQQQDLLFVDVHVDTYRCFPRVAYITLVSLRSKQPDEPEEQNDGGKE